MINSLKQLTFEETLKRINLPTLEQERERVYRVMNGVEVLNINYLLVWVERRGRKH